MKEDSLWVRFDSAVSKELLDHLDFESRLAQLELVIYEEAREMLGLVERRVLPPKQKSRRQREMCEVRNAIKAAVANQRSALSEDERLGFTCVVDELKERTQRLRLAENSRKKRWRCRKEGARFYENPYQFSKYLLQPREKASLDVSSETIDEYVKGIATDVLQEQELGELLLPEVHQSKVQFDTNKLYRSQFLEM